MDKQKIFSIFLFALVMTSVVGFVAAGSTGKISPESPTVIAGFSQSFTVSNLNASETYTITYTATGGSENTIETIEADTDGTIQFSFTPDESGTLKVKEASGIVVASTHVEVFDIVSFIMPFVVLIIVISVINKISVRIQDMI